MRLSFSPGNVHRINEMPILKAVLGNATVKWVMELSFWSLEVPIPIVVGLFVSRHVGDHHLELK